MQHANVIYARVEDIRLNVSFSYLGIITTFNIPVAVYGWNSAISMAFYGPSSISLPLFMTIGFFSLFTFLYP